MKKEDIILSALAINQDVEYTPVQVQKLFFLIDKNLSKELGGPFFNFEPYHYGPFDKEVYTELDNLREEGQVNVFSSPDNHLRKYNLSKTGIESGMAIFNDLTPEVQKYLKDLNKFVTTLSFTELVSAIYKTYPEMKANSIFND